MVLISTADPPHTVESAPEPANDGERLAAIERLRMMEKHPEKSWDRLAELASAICGTPIALVSVVGKDTQQFKARVGLEPDHTGRAESFCAHAILEHKLFQVPDAVNDVRFYDNPLVTGDPKIRFYAGMPVRMPDGMPMGTLCVIDPEPRTLSKTQEHALRLLAMHAEELLLTRAAALQLDAWTRDVDTSEVRRAVHEISHEMGTPLTPILSRIHLLKKEPLSEAASKHLEELESNVRKLVVGLRDVSRRFADLPPASPVDEQPGA